MRIVHWLAFLFGLTSVASPSILIRNCASRVTSVSQPVIIREISGVVMMYWPSMKSLAGPPGTPRRNVPPRFAFTAAGAASASALWGAPSPIAAPAAAAEPDCNARGGSAPEQILPRDTSFTRFVVHGGHVASEALLLLGHAA